jgi:hypothetical protein
VGLLRALIEMESEIMKIVLPARDVADAEAAVLGGGYRLPAARG